MSHNDSHPSTLPLRMAPFSAVLVGGGVVLGVLGIALAFLLAPSPERALTALHFNWMFWSSVAIGMVLFSVALHLTHARWAWSIKRFSLAGAGFLPVSFVIFPVMLYMGRHVFFHHWLPHGGEDPRVTDPVLHAKAAWLTFPGMMIRDMVALVVLYGLALLFTYHQLRPDMHGRGWW
jgi:MFS family permease